jgi:carbon storage regulator CsrA
MATFDANMEVDMLSLTRRPGETLILQTETEEIVIYFDLDGKQIKVGINAPSSVSILRGELEGRGKASKQSLRVGKKWPFRKK